MPTAHLATGIDLYYESHGSGEPLVLLPSTAFPADVWRDSQLPALSAAMRVIVLDVRGVGRSTHYDGVYTIEQMACDVIALLDHLDLPRAHLLGHAMGGRIALEAALDWPGRVQSLILAATGSGAAGRPGPDCLPGIPFRIVHGLTEQGFEAYLRREVVESSAYFSDSYRAANGERIRAFFEQDVWPHHARLPEYLRLVMARQYWEATHRLGEVRVPSLVLIGDQDTHGSDHVQQSKVLAARIPGAVYQELAGQSHGYFWQAPDVTNAAIRDWVLAHGA